VKKRKKRGGKEVKEKRTESIYFVCAVLVLLVGDYLCS
jgi:hypothetical protein